MLTTVYSETRSIRLEKKVYHICQVRYDRADKEHQER